MGTWHNRPAAWDNTYYDFQDTISYLVGKHTFKFGVEFARILVNATIQAAGAVMYILPVLFIFFIMQRYFIQSSVSSGVKG